MQISTYLYVSLSAMLAWQDTRPFLCEAMETDFSVFLLTSFRCNCHTHTRSYAEQLGCTVITRTEFINRKTGLKKGSFSSRVCLRLQPKRWCVEFFFSLPPESSKPGADHCKGHCHICWKSNHWYQHRKYKFENQVVCTPWGAYELKIDLTLPPTCIINM